MVYVRSQCGRKWPEIPAGPILRGDECDRRLGGPIHNGDECCQLGTSNIYLIIFMLSLALHTALSFGFCTVHLHITNIPGVTLIPQEPKMAFMPLLGSCLHSPLPECIALSAFSKLIR